MSLLTELKRRNVLRMGGLYLVGAWLVTQVANTVLPLFGAPAWIVRSVVILLAIGLIPTLIAAWVFELTPEGFKRESDLAVDEPALEAPTALSTRRIDRAIILVLVLAVSYFAIDKFVWSRAPQTALFANEGASVPPATAPDAPDPKAVARGIAVLPFDNLSPDPDNAYFAGGMYEEVLTKLAGIGELRVISRTSMERVAEEKLDAEAIGKRLAVSHVLEGSVRRAQDQIRVTVQLIEAASDAHVWAENYDRKLDDVFAIQSEIALAIAEKLEVSLSPRLEADLSERPTRNQAAYALYLRAVDEGRTWRGPAGFQAAIELLAPAVEADPSFLDAKVLLANALGRMVFLGADPAGEFAERTRQLVADILRRWPEHPQSRLAQGQMFYNLERDYGRALPHFMAALEHRPNDRAVRASVSNCLKRLGRNAEWLDNNRRLVELDPESPNNNSELILALLANHRLDEAGTFADEARARFPDDELVLTRWAGAKLARDHDSAALLNLNGSDTNLRDLVDIALYIHGDFERLNEPLEAKGNWLVFLLTERAGLLRLAGRQREAQVHIDHARTQIESWPAAAKDGEYDALAASVWALAGEPERARKHLVQARANPPGGASANFDRYAYDLYLAGAEHRLGNAEAGWLCLQRWANQPQLLSHGQLLAFQPYYDRIFGESASYRAYMAKLADETRSQP